MNTFLQPTKYKVLTALALSIIFLGIRPMALGLGSVAFIYIYTLAHLLPASFNAIIPVIAFLIYFLLNFLSWYLIVCIAFFLYTKLKRA